jgi:hypothetical protein
MGNFISSSSSALLGYLSNVLRSLFALVLGLVYITITLALVVGWIWNIVKLVQADTVSGMEIARVAGIFIAPLGALLGYF